MNKRISRFSRRFLVGAIVAIAFAAAAGVGLAEITSEPSIGTFAAVTTKATTTGAGRQKVAVCHVTGNGSSHTINIAEPAVPAHLAHGDTAGACATVATTTGGTTQTTTATTKTKKPKKPKHVHSTVHVSSSTHGNSAHSSPHGNSGSSHGQGNGHNK
jgi:hypothetical protein